MAGTALVSVGFAPEAAAVCTVNNTGTVNCATNTTTTNTTNLNGATAASNDRIQEFNNGNNINASVSGGVTVGGFGLNLVLSNAGGNNALTIVNDGVITTNQAVNALHLNGNGGNLFYTGTGNVTNTGTGNAIEARNTAGGVTIFVGTTSTIQSASNASAAVVVLTTGGGITVQGTASSGNLIGGAVGALLTSGGGVTVTNLGLIRGNNGNAIFAISSGGGGTTISSNQQIVGTGSRAIVAFSGGGGLSIANNGSISGVGGILASSAGGSLSISGNGNITGGIAALSGSGGLSIQGNGNITEIAGDGIFADSGGGGLSIGSVTPNGAVTGSLNGIIAASGGSGLAITTGGAVTGNTATGITAASSGGGMSLTLNHNVTGATHGLNLSGAGGGINVTNTATLTGGTNAILGSTTGVFTLINLAGTINGNVNVTGSNVGASAFTNIGTWNTGTANSAFSGGMSNVGTLNALNAVGQQTINISGPYDGGGAVRVDLGDRLQMGGPANLTGGTLNAAIAPNSGLAHSFVVLSAAGGLGGTTFATTTVTVPNVTTSVTYTATDVIVNILAAQLGAGSNLNQNQTNVATPINNFFNGGGNLPAGFGGLFALTGAPLGNALTQLSGENATGVQPAANLSMGLFLNAMLDPFAAGRTGGVGAPLGYAQETPSRVAVAARDAFAADMPVKAPLATIVEQRWSVWGAAYGGRNRTDGDAAVGSNDLRATVGGFAAGADYRVSPSSVIGAAVAIGETRWNVSGLGKGNADVAQFGGYFLSRWESLYVSGAVALAWHRASTDRTLNIAGTDRLEADFNATSFGGRLEGGYRYGSVGFGVTPYAAVQVTGIHTPSYTEVATAGLNQFALSYRAQSTNDIRSELGVWADTRYLFGNGALVTLRGRAAWVHDYNPGSRVNAAFQTLPGTSFTVDGAAAPRDAALTSAVAELRFTNGVTLIGKFDGEFSGHARTVTGTGTARYAW